MTVNTSANANGSMKTIPETEALPTVTATTTATATIATDIPKDTPTLTPTNPSSLSFFKSDSNSASASASIATSTSTASSTSTSTTSPSTTLPQHVVSILEQCREDPCAFADSLWESTSTCKTASAATADSYQPSSSMFLSSLSSSSSSSSSLEHQTFLKSFAFRLLQDLEIEEQQQQQEQQLPSSPPLRVQIPSYRASVASRSMQMPYSSDYNAEEDEAMFSFWNALVLNPSLPSSSSMTTTTTTTPHILQSLFGMTKAKQFQQSVQSLEEQLLSMTATANSSGCENGDTQGNGQNDVSSLQQQQQQQQLPSSQAPSQSILAKWLEGPAKGLSVKEWILLIPYHRLIGAPPDKAVEIEKKNESKNENEINLQLLYQIVLEDSRWEWFMSTLETALYDWNMHQLVPVLFHPTIQRFWKDNIQRHCTAECTTTSTTTTSFSRETPPARTIDDKITNIHLTLMAIGTLQCLIFIARVHSLMDILDRPEAIRESSSSLLLPKVLRTAQLLQVYSMPVLDQQQHQHNIPLFQPKALKTMKLNLRAHAKVQKKEQAAAAAAAEQMAKLQESARARENVSAISDDEVLRKKRNLSKTICNEQEKGVVFHTASTEVVKRRRVSSTPCVAKKDRGQSQLKRATKPVAISGKAFTSDHPTTDNTVLRNSIDPLSDNALKEVLDFIQNISPERILDLPVERLDVQSGKVLARYTSGRKALKYLKYGDAYTFALSLLGKRMMTMGLEAQIYFGFFWRFQGTKEKPLESLSEQELLTKYAVEKLQIQTGAVVASYPNALEAIVSWSTNVDSDDDDDETDDEDEKEPRPLLENEGINSSPLWEQRRFYMVLMGKKVLTRRGKDRFAFDHPRIYRGFYWRLKGSGHLPPADASQKAAA